ncbi:WD40 repeat domain-containing protein [Thalassoroseus pseudoceratinae]|uniref:WD40 repeat domain-containing protein n=1 Tax=Thalassoroseus pseudoceratinae TaxID=2713176 RepID=UPI0014235A66|nr:hypothetical protein [Thalassoroseus pseudoceratinae]
MTNQPAIAQSRPAIAEPSVRPKQTRELQSFKHDRPLTTCRVDSQARFAFAGAEDFFVHRWNLQTGEKTTLEGPQSWVRCIDISPDDETIVAADWRGRLCWWRTSDASTKPIRTVQAHQGSCRWVRFSPDGSQLITCGNDLLIKLWQADGTPIAEFAGHERYPYAVVFHPQRAELASQDLLGNVKIWDIEKHAEKKTIPVKVMTGYDKVFAADMGGPRDLQFDPAGERLLCTGITNVKNAFAGVQDPILVSLDLNTDELKPMKVAKNFQGIAWGGRFHPAGFVMGCGANRTGKGAIWYWEVGQDQPFHTHDLKSAARGMDLTQHHQTAVIAHADGSLKTYSLVPKTA